MPGLNWLVSDVPEAARETRLMLKEVEVVPSEKSLEIVIVVPACEAATVEPAHPTLLIPAAPYDRPPPYPPG